MDDKKMERYGALAGIVFVVLNIIGMVLVGTPPSNDDSNAEILEWFVDKESGIKSSAFVGAISVIFMLWFLGTLWRHMVKADGGSTRASLVSASGLIASGALWMGSAAIQAGTAMEITDLGEGSGVFYTMSVMFMYAAGAFVSAHLLAANLLALRTKWLPSWHAGIGLLAGLGFIVGAAGVMTDSSAVMAIGMISFLVWSLWIILTAVQMYRKPA